MIKELSWYFEDNQFTNLYKELKTSIEEYEEAKKHEDAQDEQYRLRENARELFEEHCVKSGLRKKELLYINIDTEFFNGDIIDEIAFNRFIKNIIKGYCYQKVLWQYMGTTGSYTEISKSDMSAQGQKYENYLPLEFTNTHPRKKTLKETASDNTVPIYLYSDGTVSNQYDKEKARYRHDALSDKSGMNWNKSYDPNDMIIKNNWYGNFNTAGSWEKITNEQNKEERESNLKTQEIKIIKDGDSAILYDPGMVLFDAGSLMYLTEDGNEYGRLENDIDQTMKAVREKLSSLGSRNIKAVGIPNNDNEKLLDHYRSKLKDLAISNMALMDMNSVNTFIMKEHNEMKNKSEEKSGIEIEKIIHSVSATEKDERKNAIIRALQENIMTVPLVPTNSKDAAIFGLSNIEIEEIANQKISDENKIRYETTLSNLYAGWNAFKESKMNRIQLAKNVQSYFDHGKILEDETIRADITLETLFADPHKINTDSIHFYVPNIPGNYQIENTIDLYNKEARENYIKHLEEIGMLPKNGASAAMEILNELLPINLTGIEKDKINRFILRGLKEYQTISMSTGMTIREVIEAAIISAKSARTNNSTASVLKKNIAYEIPLAKLIESASKKNYQSRDISVTSMYREQEHEKSRVIIGGTSGKSLSDFNFDEFSLEKKYHYTKQAASKLAAFLKNIRIKNTSSSLILTDVTDVLFSGIEKIIAHQKNLTLIEKSIIHYLEKRDDTSFNLKSDEGLTAYKMSNRYKESGLSHESLKELIKEYKTETIPEKNIVSLTPKYRDTGTILSVNRTRAKGIPENIILRENKVSTLLKTANEMQDKNYDYNSQEPKKVYQLLGLMPISDEDEKENDDNKKLKRKTREHINISGNHKYLLKDFSEMFAHQSEENISFEGLSTHIHKQMQPALIETKRLHQIETDYEKDKSEWNQTHQIFSEKSRENDLTYFERDAENILSRREEQIMRREFLKRISAHLNA